MTKADSTKKLTPKQTRILEILKDRDNWLPPGLRSLTRLAGTHDTRSTIDMLRAMEKKGFVRKVYCRALRRRKTSVISLI